MAPEPDGPTACDPTHGDCLSTAKDLFASPAGLSPSAPDLDIVSSFLNSPHTTSSTGYNIPGADSSTAPTDTNQIAALPAECERRRLAATADCNPDRTHCFICDREGDCVDFLVICRDPSHPSICNICAIVPLDGSSGPPLCRYNVDIDLLPSPSSLWCQTWSTRPECRMFAQYCK